ncbi:MAG: corrinoid protein [Dethiobacteria bacterium]|nr:corrinoid protein [Bacillota bacterium]MDW7729526.1 corrinoid protein [Bacillota bacterium]
MSKDIVEMIVDNVLQGRRNKDDEGIEDGVVGQPGVAELVEEALETGIEPDRILLKGLSRGMELVGAKYESGEYFIPDMLTAAEAVEAGMKVMEPHLTGQGDNGGKGKIVLATVEKDLHDIGKNLVAIMLKGAGFSVIDLGIDVPAARIVEVAEDEDAQIIGLSALLNTTMKNMEEVVTQLEQKGLRNRVKVLIGGAPTSGDFARQIGADSYGKDAFAAIREAEKLLKAGGDS